MKRYRVEVLIEAEPGRAQVMYETLGGCGCFPPERIEVGELEEL